MSAVTKHARRNSLVSFRGRRCMRACLINGRTPSGILDREHGVPEAARNRGEGPAADDGSFTSGGTAIGCGSKTWLMDRSTLAPRDCCPRVRRYDACTGEPTLVCPKDNRMGVAKPFRRVGEELSNEDCSEETLEPEDWQVEVGHNRSTPCVRRKIPTIQHKIQYIDRNLNSYRMRFMPVHDWVGPSKIC